MQGKWKIRNAGIKKPETQNIKTYNNKMSNVKKAEGKLGVMVVGLGAVTTTFMTGVLMTRKGLAKPVGSMTQYDKIRVGEGADKKYLKYNEIVPIADLNDIVFGAWDVYPANAYESTIHTEVLKEKDVNPVKDELEAIKPLKAAFDHNYAKRLDGDNIMVGKTRWEMVEQLREDIRNFKKENGVDRVVVLWAASSRRQGKHRTFHVLRLCRTYRRMPLHHGRTQHNGRHTCHVGARRKDQNAHCRQGLQDRPDPRQIRIRSYHRHTLPRSERMVLNKHPRQPRRSRT